MLVAAKKYPALSTSIFLNFCFLLCLFVCFFHSVFEGPGFKGNLDVPSICWYFIYCEGIQRFSVNTTVLSHKTTTCKSRILSCKCVISLVTQGS